MRHYAVASPPFILACRLFCMQYLHNGTVALLLPNDYASGLHHALVLFLGLLQLQFLTDHTGCKSWNWERPGSIAPV